VNEFKKGDRVELVSTTDPHTNLLPGAQGEVYSVRRVLDDVAVGVRWDSGSTLSMLLSEDVIRKI
jgi:hypothetical protein